jgi:hypothetical protein
MHTTRTRARRALQKEKREGKRRELQAQVTRLTQAISDEKSRRKSKALEQGWKVGVGVQCAVMAGAVTNPCCACVC